MKRDEDYLKLVDGVKVLNFGSGHAWGMIGLEIETEELGTIILALRCYLYERKYGTNT